MKTVGKVKDAHSLKGEIYVILFSKDQSYYTKIKDFQLIDEKNNTFHTFNIEKIKPHKEGFIIKAKELNDRNQSEAVKGHLFAVDDSLFISAPGEEIFLIEILNFKVFDHPSNGTRLGDVKYLGQVTGFFDNGAQDLLIVSDEIGSFEIPFVESFFESINYEKKEIYVTLPEGLIEINRVDHKSKILNKENND